MPDMEVEHAPVVNPGQDEWLDILGSGDIKVKTLVESKTGIKPQTSDLCTINLKAELEDGTVIEDHEKLIVELNGSEVVQGLDLVLSLMGDGSKVTAIVKSRFAYGKLGHKPSVPPDVTLIYTIELLKIDDAPELTNISFENRKAKAIFKKDRGNWWFSRGDAQKSIQCYRAALDTLQESTPYIASADEKATDMPEEIFRDFVKQKMVIYNNLAAAQILMSAYDSALDSVNRVIQIEPGNVKALYRKGKILAAQGKTEEAVDTFKKASGLEPENSSIRKELAASLKRLQAEKEQAKNLYRRMLGSAAEPEEQQPSSPKSPGVSPATKILSGAAVATTVVAALAYAFSFKLKDLMFWE